MARRALTVNLSESDRQELERWVRAHRTPQQVAQRCRIILAAANGQQDKAIAKQMQINYKTAALWRQRFCSEGSDCLWEVAAGRGRQPKLIRSLMPHCKRGLLEPPIGVAEQWLKSRA
jgi:DNA-binding CsgD family transcriptional regulator